MKQDEMLGDVEGTSYDFGARIYDSRLGRFLSLDPEFRDNPFESNYAYAENNPIYYIDFSGGNNYVYIVLLPSANTEINRQTMKEVVKQINKAYAAMGIDTKVKLARKSTIDPTKLDANDSFVLVGNPKEILSTVTNADGSAKKGFEDLYEIIAPKTDYPESGWKGGATEPENSATGNYNSEQERHIATASNAFKKGVAIDFEGLELSRVKILDGLLTQTQWFALTIMHGLGHNTGGSNIAPIQRFSKAGKSHVTEGIGMDASQLRLELKNGETFENIISSENNEKYIRASQFHMGIGCAEDNYQEP